MQSEMPVHRSMDIGEYTVSVTQETPSLYRVMVIKSIGPCGTIAVKPFSVVPPGDPELIVPHLRATSWDLSDAYMHAITTLIGVLIESIERGG